MLFRTATLLLPLTVVVAAATNKATIDDNSSSSSSEAGTPSRRRRKNLMAKKNYLQPAQPPTQTPDDHGVYGGYPRVTIKNKTNYAASGQVTYLGDATGFVDPDFFHINPGETWIGHNRGLGLLACVMANMNVPTIVNARDYQSSGTSYAAFEIVFNVTDGGFIAQRVGQKWPGPLNPLVSCIAQANMLFTCGGLDPDTCGTNPYRTYHPVWPPICPFLTGEKGHHHRGYCVCPAEFTCNDSQGQVKWNTCDEILCPEQTSKPTLVTPQPTPQPVKPSVKPTMSPTKAKQHDPTTNSALSVGRLSKIRVIPSISNA